VNAYAFAGGRDVADMFGSAGDDVFYSDPIQAALYSTWFYNRVKYFEEVNAHGGGGENDRADLFDSALVDLLEADDDWARLSHDDAMLYFVYSVKDFDSVKVWSENDSRNTKNVATDLLFDLYLEGTW